MLEQKNNTKGIKQVLELIKRDDVLVNENLDAININNYKKTFKNFIATKDVTFSVKRGVIHGFIGPNGAGKTTVIKALIGAYVPTEGELKINGNTSGTTNANKLIGYIPERASFPKHLNTLDYLSSMGELSGLNRKDAQSKAIGILEALGLEEHSKRKPISFSSGMKKKILLAQSLLTDPQILILDEPAANLDPTSRQDLFDQLIYLRNQGKTIFVSSHILAELERLVDEVTFIYYGQIVYSGSVSELANDKSNVYIKSKNNKELAEFLKEKKYLIAGDLKTEVIVKDVEPEGIKKLFVELAKTKFTIITFRANDLQSIYDKFIEKSEIENLGNQEIDNKKVIAMNKSNKLKVRKK